MIEVKIVTNTNNKEEFINKKTLRRLFSEHLLTVAQVYKRRVETDSLSVSSSFDSILDITGTGCALGVITGDESDYITSITCLSSQLVKPLALVAIDVLCECLNRL